MTSAKDVKPPRRWIECARHLPMHGLIVETKIDDAKGVRNEQQLKRQGALWFFPNSSMYVYYSPTHWRAIVSARVPEGAGTVTAG